MSRFMAVVCLSAVAAVPAALPATPPAVPGLSVSDLIGLTRIGSEFAGGFGGDDDVVSPDGKYVALVTQRGDVATNTREFSLLVFDNGDAVERRPPDRAALFVTKSNRPAIAKLVWLSNSVLGFIAESPETLPQVYSLDLHTRQLIQRTHATLAVTVFKAIDGGATLIYATEDPPADAAAFSLLRLHGFTVPPDAALTDVITGKWEQIDSRKPARSVLHVLHNGVEGQIDLPDPEQYGDAALDGSAAAGDLSLAPSGDVVLIREFPRAVPAGWSEYGESRLRKGLAAGAQYAWWVMLDLGTGIAHPLTGAPTLNFSSVPAWVADGSAVLLVNDLLPLADADASERNMRANTRGTALVDVRHGAVKIVPPPKMAVKSSIEILEGPSQPWQLAVSTSRGAHKRVIFDPNPLLRSGRRLANVTILNATGKSGAQIAAGVYWPLDYQSGKRYPLVIQTHGFDPRKFAPDGYSTTGYAGQPLAADGIMVVQAYQCVEDCENPARSALPEGERVQEALEALIDRLDGLGVIDREKIALQGYSRSCYHELYFVTHSDDAIAALLCTDGIDESYLQYLVFGPHSSALRTDFEAHNGGRPAGPTLKNWLLSSPGFNLQRIHTPVRLVALSDGSSLLQEWEPFAGLVLQGKPAELFYLPEASHNIVRPWERIASQQGSVDWFRFWLQGYERSQPIVEAQESQERLSDQYRRWKRLCALQIAANPGAPAFCVST
jgi:hypothetical protein